MRNRFLIAGAFAGAIAVALGAFGAHGLKNLLSPGALKTFHTGVEYQFYHAFALLATGILSVKSPMAHLNRAGNLFMAGIIFFSGSLYCLSVFPALAFMGIITPIGGLCFIAGWALLALAFMKK